MKSVRNCIVLSGLLAALLCAQAPFDYSLKVMDTQGKMTDFSAYKGRHVLLVYYSLTCKSCELAVKVLEDLAAQKTCLDIAGVISGGEKEEEFLASAEKRPFPKTQYFDKNLAFKTFFKFGRVPATVIVGKDGRVRYCASKFTRENYRDMVAVLEGQVCRGTPFTEMMESRYYGEYVCEACHAAVDSVWQASPHAGAFRTLARAYFKKSGYRAGDEKRIKPECLKCHTVGHGDKTGYSPELGTKHLLGVQCESCHPAAGPHDRPEKPDYEGKCVSCHNTVRDPTFNYRDGLKKLDHP